MLLVKNAKHFIDGEVRTIDLFIEKGVISNMSSSIFAPLSCREIDFAGNYIVPGFIDIHTHGAFGTDFNNPEHDALLASLKYYASHGVTSLLATIVADKKEKMLSLCSDYAEYMLDSQFCQISGIHLEGPFLSKEYSGAINPKYLLDGDVEFLSQLQKAAKGNIKLITVSPEVKNILDVIKVSRELDIAVSIGHSGASYSQTINAISSGAAGATHFFNAMKPLSHHEGGIISAALESGIYCEMIADGIHINKDIFKMVYNIKGKDGIIPITDSIMAAGMGDGEYRLGSQEIIVKNNKAFLKNSTRAGSTLGMNQVLKSIIDFLNISVWDASYMISTNPAHKVLHEKSLGQLSIGSKADFVRLDQDSCVIMTFKSGKLIYCEDDYYSE
ncbi:MAG: N-acetylglucosamine-6-phosphate deacetylase [Eubacteriales bacterium]